MKRQCTYCLTDDGVFDSIDASGKHSEGQSRVETEVEEHVPSLPTDADCAAKRKTHTVSQMNMNSTENQGNGLQIDGEDVEHFRVFKIPTSIMQVIY
jgi:hypothetical protein